MYRGLRDAKLLRCRTDGGFMLDNVLSHNHRPFFDVPFRFDFHTLTPIHRFSFYVYAGEYGINS